MGRKKIKIEIIKETDDPEEDKEENEAVDKSPIRDKKDEFPNILDYITDEDDPGSSSDEESSGLEEAVLGEDQGGEKSIDELDEIKYHNPSPAEEGVNADYSIVSDGYRGLYDDNQKYEPDDKERILGPEKRYEGGVRDTKNPNELDEEDSFRSIRVISPHETYRKRERS